MCACWPTQIRKGHDGYYEVNFSARVTTAADGFHDREMTSSSRIVRLD